CRRRVCSGFAPGCRRVCAASRSAPATSALGHHADTSLAPACPARWCPLVPRVSCGLPWPLIPARPPLHTAWLPQPCHWSCMAAASMSYGPVLEEDTGIPGASIPPALAGGPHVIKFRGFCGEPAGRRRRLHL